MLEAPVENPGFLDGGLRENCPAVGLRLRLM